MGSFVQTAQRIANCWPVKVFCVEAVVLKEGTNLKTEVAKVGQHTYDLPSPVHRRQGIGH